MVNTKCARLLADLKDATANGRVRWNKTAEETMFRIVLGKGMVRIGYTDDGTVEEPVYSLFLLADDGTVVDTEAISSQDPECDLAAQLYKMARRSAGNVDALLDSMLRDLDARTAKPS